MICDIIERINIKQVDKCIDSDLHLDPIYITMHPNTERLVCHTLHIKGPHYRKSFYALDMIWNMLTEPRRTKQLWREFKREMWKR